MIKFDFGRVIKAPFIGDGKTDLKKVYLMATIITFVIFAIIMVVALGSEFLKLAIFGISSTTIIPQIVFSIAFSLVVIIFQIFLYGLPFGYVNETIRLEVRDCNSIMLGWDGNYKKFYFDGMKLMFIVFIYFAILVFMPTIIVGILCYFSVGLPLSDSALMSEFPIGLILIGITYLAMAFIYFLIFPFVWIRYAVEERFLEAFNLGEIIQKISKNFLSYILALLLVFVMVIVMQISLLILTCTCIGLIFLPVVSMFIFPIMFANMFAQIYKD